MLPPACFRQHAVVGFRRPPRDTVAFLAQTLFVFDDHHPHMEKLRTHEPPVHFHELQVEYFKVLEGSIDVDVGDRRVRLTPADGELEVPTWYVMFVL
ncbi:hypothetical protein GRF29_44g1365675 [Pseudopithomyces chartarum]|uniref:Cupin domain-containing protein n=1 Tax=Pseudopithomyces chartarum TaxID=1892770 RepID=A0AAN6RIK0_9PLEO|nr:hypothetical protein GRF29_44g1365675 [Pseudopithomyces chartarum]